MSFVRTPFTKKSDRGCSDAGVFKSLHGDEFEDICFKSDLFSSKVTNPFSTYEGDCMWRVKTLVFWWFYRWEGTRSSVVTFVLARLVTSSTRMSYDGWYWNVQFLHYELQLPIRVPVPDHRELCVAPFSDFECVQGFHICCGPPGDVPLEFAPSQPLTTIFEVDLRPPF